MCVRGVGVAGGDRVPGPRVPHMAAPPRAGATFCAEGAGGPHHRGLPRQHRPREVPPPCTPCFICHVFGVLISMHRPFNLQGPVNCLPDTACSASSFPSLKTHKVSVICSHSCCFALSQCKLHGQYLCCAKGSAFLSYPGMAPGYVAAALVWVTR